MTIEIALLISIVSVGCTIIYTVKNSNRADTARVEQKAVETAVINTKLDQIGSDVRDIKYDISDVKKDVVNLGERMIVVEQSTKSAHKRLDELVKEGSE